MHSLPPNFVHLWTKIFFFLKLHVKPLIISIYTQKSFVQENDTNYNSFWTIKLPSNRAKNLHQLLHFAFRVCQASQTNYINNILHKTWLLFLYCYHAAPMGRSEGIIIPNSSTFHLYKQLLHHVSAKLVCVRELGKSCHPRSALLVFHPRIIVSPPDRQFDRLLKRHAGKK